MSVMLIAENVIKKSNFSSATSQAGPRWGVPDAAAANEGHFRLLAIGTPTWSATTDDGSYSGTATSNGNVGGTTVIDSALSVFGDDWFIVGYQITMTSGTCDTEVKTISDFDQATGTITVSSAFSAQIDSGDTFAITMSYVYLNNYVELIASGDAGTATFKWSPNGTTYFGRDSPNQATYLAPTVFTVDNGNATAANVRLVDMGDDGVLAIWSADDGDIHVFLSTNNGITWTDIATIATSNSLGGTIRLSSGRILAAVSTVIYYSDDNGDTWSTGPTVNAFNGFAEIGGMVIGVVAASSNIYCKVSSDDGMTWSSAITIADTGNTCAEPDICVAANGSLVCVYRSDEDAAGSDEIKAKISTDNGSSWGSVIAVINFTTDVSAPSIMMDINGDLYVVAHRADADQPIILSRSTDNGETWSTGSILTVATAAGKDYAFPDIELVQGHQVWVIWCNDTDGTVMMARRGIWELYSANACPCAINVIEQKLTHGGKIAWHGGAGIAGDVWTWEPDYEYSMKNIIEDSPSRCYRSAHGQLIGIVIDMSTELMYADSVAFFGCNVRTIDVMMNATNAWGAPSVDETVTFDLTTGGALDAAIAANEIKDSSLMAGYDDHSLKNHFVRFTSGNLANYTYKIKDNVGDYIFVYEDINADEAVAGNAAVNDTFAIYQDHVSKTFTGGGYRYLAINIPLQYVPAEDDSLYKIGTMVIGKSITLTDAFMMDYGLDNTYGITMLRTSVGGMVPVKNHGRKRVYRLGWAGSASGRKEMLATVDYLDGKNIAMILDTSNMKDCVLVKLIGDVTQTHLVGEVFSVNMTFEEVL